MLNRQHRVDSNIQCIAIHLTRMLQKRGVYSAQVPRMESRMARGHSAKESAGILAWPLGRLPKSVATELQKCHTEKP